MSTRPEVSGKTFPSDAGAVWFTGDAFPPRPAVGPCSGRNASKAGLLQCARPESLGKKIPGNSGPVPMTAGRFPV
jgi:hypothetical protein